MKRSKTNSQPPTDKKTLRQALIFGSVFSLLLLFGLFLLILTAASDNQSAASYRKSPNCISGSSASAGPTPCVFLTEHVVSKHQEAGARGVVNYFVELQTGAAAPEEAEIIDSHCWAQLAVGDAVTTQTWQGHVTTVAAHNRQSQTANNPLYRISTDRELAFLLMPLTLFFVTTTFLAWKRTLREKAAPT